MPNTDALVEAEWHMREVEDRVMLAMRMRASNDNDIDDARVSDLFSELQAAIARFRDLQASLRGDGALDARPAIGKANGRPHGSNLWRATRPGCS